MLKENASVSDLLLKASSPLAGALEESRSSVSLEVLDSYTAAHIGTRKGADEALLQTCEQAYGFKLPSAGKMVAGSSVSAVWAGPGQWLVFAPDSGGRDLEQELRAKLGALASVADQGDARMFVRVAGPSSRDMLAKLLPLDIHPRAFPPGSAAITHAAHIGVMVWRSDKPRTTDCFILACSRSYAQSLWHALMDAAAEFGVSVG